jgi:hypothetical protein
MRFSTRNLTALGLTMIYVIVGFLGESLHYVASGEHGFSREPAGAKSSVYGHCHAPDFHFHFHRHVHEGELAHPDGHGPTGRLADHPHERSIRALARPHEPHACPLLALIGTLKSGFVRLAAGIVELPDFVQDVAHHPTCRALVRASASSARGPPPATLASFC